MKSRMIQTIAAVAFMVSTGTAMAKTDSGERTPTAVSNGGQQKVDNAECSLRSGGSLFKKSQILPDGNRTADLSVGNGKK
jgi:hypothetical protein